MDIQEFADMLARKHVEVQENMASLAAAIAMLYRTVADMDRKSALELAGRLNVTIAAMQKAQVTDTSWVAKLMSDAIEGRLDQPEHPGAPATPYLRLITENPQED